MKTKKKSKFRNLTYICGITFSFVAVLWSAISLRASATSLTTVPLRQAPISTTLKPQKRSSVLIVPDVRGIELEQVIRFFKLRHVNLKIKVTQRIFCANSLKDVIISQEPLPGTTVPVNSTLNLVISKGPPPDVKLKKVPRRSSSMVNRSLEPLVSSNVRLKKKRVSKTTVTSDGLHKLPKKALQGAKISSAQKLSNHFESSSRKKDLCKITIKNKEVHEGSTVVIIKKKSLPETRYIFFIGSHRVPSPSVKEFHKISLSTKGIPPGKYPLIARYGRNRVKIGDIIILPANRGCKTHPLHGGILLSSKHMKSLKRKPSSVSLKSGEDTDNQPFLPTVQRPQIGNKKAESLMIISVPKGRFAAFRRIVKKKASFMVIRKSHFVHSLGVILVQVATTDLKKMKQEARKLSAKKIIRSFQPNYHYKTNGLSEDPLAKRQYGCFPLKRLYRLLRTCHVKPVDVALLDTGVDIYHEDLDSSRIETKDFTDGSFGQFLEDIHGTAICGIIAAISENGKGITGLAPFAKIHAIKVCKSIRPSSIQAVTDTFTFALGLDYVIQKRYPLVNVSIGGPRDRIIEKLIRKATQEGIIIVAAVGNNGPRASPSYPAAYPHVLGVTAIDQNLNLYPRAYQGQFVDLAAPGVDVFSLKPGNRYNFYTGTSFAAAYVTGLIALKCSCLRKTTSIKEDELLPFFRKVLVKPKHFTSFKFGKGILILSKIKVGAFLK